MTPIPTRDYGPEDGYAGSLAAKAQELADQAQADLDEQAHYHFRSTVRPQHDDSVIGSGPVEVWAEDEDDARRQAIAFERETFGAPRARVDLELVSVDGVDVFDGPEVLTRTPGGPR